MQKQKNIPNADPRLKEAIAQIDDICKKYEVAYICVISNRTHTEYKSDFPAWSLIH